VQTLRFNLTKHGTLFYTLNLLPKISHPD